MPCQMGLCRATHLAERDENAHFDEERFGSLLQSWTLTDAQTGGCPTDLRTHLLTCLVLEVPLPCDLLSHQFRRRRATPDVHDQRHEQEEAQRAKHEAECQANVACLRAQLALLLTTAIVSWACHTDFAERAAVAFGA
jgi:hypothetical protein